MSSQICEYEGCENATKGRYCPEHKAEYDDMLFDMMKDNEVER